MKIKRQSLHAKTYETGHGELVPAVTEVLQLAERWDMQRWIAKVGKAEADRIGTEAKVFGSKVHATAQEVARTHEENKERRANGLPEGTVCTQEFAEYQFAIKEFYDKWVDTVVATELALTSNKWGFGGTLDSYVKLTTGEFAVVDFKTSKSITRVHGMQLCAYGMLLREHGYPVNRRLGVKIRKDKPGKWGLREFKNHREDYEGFVGALALWKWQRARMLEREAKKVNE